MIRWSIRKSQEKKKKEICITINQINSLVLYLDFNKLTNLLIISFLLIQELYCSFFILSHPFWPSFPFFILKILKDKTFRLKNIQKKKFATKVENNSNIDMTLGILLGIDSIQLGYELWVKLIPCLPQY